MERAKAFASTFSFQALNRRGMRTTLTLSLEREVLWVIDYCSLLIKEQKQVVRGLRVYTPYFLNETVTSF